MVKTDVVRIALELPAEERLELARQLVESVVTPETLSEAVREGIRRVEQIATGKVAGLTEKEFVDSLK